MMCQRVKQAACGPGSADKDGKGKRMYMVVVPM